MTHGGRYEHLKSSAKRFSVISHITVWGIGKQAPPVAAGAAACREGAAVHRGRLCEKERVGGRGGQFMVLPNGTRTRTV